MTAPVAWCINCKQYVLGTSAGVRRWAMVHEEGCCGVVTAPNGWEADDTFGHVISVYRRMPDVA